VKVSLKRPKTSLQAHLVPDHALLLNYECRCCTRPVRAGESVVTDVILGAPHGSQTWVVHTRCLRDLVAEAPLEADELTLAFEAVCRDVAENGLI
jgi:hypothetical protein